MEWLECQRMDVRQRVEEVETNDNRTLAEQQEKVRGQPYRIVGCAYD